MKVSNIGTNGIERLIEEKALIEENITFLDAIRSFLKRKPVRSNVLTIESLSTATKRLSDISEKEISLGVLIKMAKEKGFLLEDPERPEQELNEQSIDEGLEYIIEVLKLLEKARKRLDITLSAISGRTL